MTEPTKDYIFTQDWFHWAPELFKQIVPMLPARHAILELGSFEGRSAVWLAEYVLEDGGHIDCVDTWQGGEDHKPEEVKGIRERFDHNKDVAESRWPNRIIDPWTGKTDEILRQLYDAGFSYDLIYIDAGHTAPEVMVDAVLSWPLLKQGGIVVFDDYLWGNPRDLLHRPKMAIDSFLNVFAEQLEIVHLGYQVAVRKK